MAERESPDLVTTDADVDDSASDVVLRTNPAMAMARALVSAPALALTSLIAATATTLAMSVAGDIAQAKFYSSRGINNLEILRWESGVRLVIAAVALGLAVAAGVRYSRGLPATRYTFSPDGEEAVESTIGSDPPGWMVLLVGSSLAMSILAVVWNAVALAMTLHLHESPNFGIPSG